MLELNKTNIGNNILELILGNDKIFTIGTKNLKQPGVCVKVKILGDNHQYTRDN